MSRLRAFIAVEFPESTHKILDQQISSLRQSLGSECVRWIAARNIHLTLKFLGEIESNHVDFLKQLLANDLKSFSVCEVQIGGLGSFPNPKRPRVIWIGLQIPATLIALQQTIEDGTARLGFGREVRQFSPHLTVGRVRPNLSVSDLNRLSQSLSSIQLGNIASVKVDSVHLFRSELKPAGAVYTKLYSQALAPPSPVGR